MGNVLLSGGLDVRILQIYSYYRSAGLNENHVRPPPRPQRGLLTILAFFFTVGWLLTLLLTVASWVFIITGMRAGTGMRLLGLIPVAGFLEPPDERFETSTLDVAFSLESGKPEQVHPALRLSYTALVGWWLSAVVLLVSWFLLVTIVGIRLSPSLYRSAPRLATLAVYGDGGNA